MSRKSSNPRCFFLSVIVTLMVLGQAAPVSAYHNEEDPPKRAYYLGGFATQGAGVIPNLQENVGICQKLSWETIHEPVGIGGACRLPLNAGDNIIWLYDDAWVEQDTGNLHHQVGFWFRCIYTNGEGNPAIGNWLYTDEYATTFGSSRPFYYTEVAWDKKCPMVDVVVPFSATVGEITVTEPCKDFINFEEPCVGAPGYWDDVDDLISPVSGLYRQAHKLAFWILGAILGLLPSGLGGDYLSVPMPPEIPLPDNPDPKDYLSGEGTLVD